MKPTTKDFISLPFKSLAMEVSLHLPNIISNVIT